MEIIQRLATFKRGLCGTYSIKSDDVYLLKFIVKCLGNNGSVFFSAFFLVVCSVCASFFDISNDRTG